MFITGLILNNDFHFRNMAGNHYTYFIIFGLWLLSFASMLKFMTTEPGYLKKQSITDDDNVLIKIAAEYKDYDKKKITSIDDTCLICL